jgi:hypothetical protein
MDRRGRVEARFERCPLRVAELGQAVCARLLVLGLHAVERARDPCKVARAEAAFKRVVIAADPPRELERCRDHAASFLELLGFGLAGQLREKLALLGALGGKDRGILQSVEESLRRLAAVLHAEEVLARDPRVLGAAAHEVLELHLAAPQSAQVRGLLDIA